MAATSSYRICPLCEACCGLEITHEDGKVLSIRGAAEDGFSNGYICPKGVSLADLHEDPDRLRKPLVKRNGRFEEASFDEAFAEIERGLLPIIEKHGPDAVGTVLGNPVAHRYGLSLYAIRMLRELRSPYVFSASTVDQMPKHRAVGAMFGSWLSVPVPDITRTDLLIVLGGNPMASNGSMWTVPDFRGKARELRARGGRLVTIDPRRTETAKVADEHHFIRPGGDIYLLLGMAHTLFDENLVRLGRLGEWINGLKALEAALKPFPAEEMAPLCGMEAETVRQLARDLARMEKAVLYGRIGTCLQSFATLNNWLVDVINILTGHLDSEGGAMFPKAPAFAHNTKGKPGQGRGVPVARRHSRVARSPDVMGEFPVSTMAEEITGAGENGIRALFSVAANPVLSTPDGEKLAAALDQLDFMVSFDIYLNETTRHANVILPPPSALADDHWDISFSQLSWRNYARYSEPLLQKDPEQPEEWEIIQRVVALLRGLGKDADIAALDDEMTREEVEKAAGPMADQVMAAVSAYRGPQRLLELELRSGPYGDGFGANPQGLTLAKVKAERYGIDLGALQPRIPEILRTPSGKIELAPEEFIADLNRVQDTLADPIPDLVMIGRRDVRSNNSWMHNLPTLAKGPNRFKALINPEDARRHGLKDGDLAEFTANGHTIQAPVELTEDMMRGVISLPHGWGHDQPGTKGAVAARNPGANVNRLIATATRDPLSGNSVLNGISVSMRRAQDVVTQAAE
ncbi:molybdopterin-dependent oxidoreductase [Rhizobium sp. L1K21]|uniref:molybdopterin-dependent oxidoreductase n=1 Tax=Rhizobium sp. L1K21 TaxID=2954933 RepID=UPI00209206AD|nr:molybdopterin-dependent oxidoreductase [Rhizobium sp. L1K21]MCO6186547.1 molybdopterin-dependent oxidoreductase [Rhizobium sp. L1K21]